MQNILAIMNRFQSYILIGLILVVIILFIMLISTMSSLKTLKTKHRKLMRGVESKNLEQIVTAYLDKVDEVKEQNDNMKELFNSLDLRIQGCLQKFSILRYRAFEDVGSDLSFSIALLDQNNDGILITGIYGRNECTTYAKPVDRGISRYELSQEENHVLQEAINKVTN